MATRAILDMTAGGRRVWFESAGAVFLDSRFEVAPNVVARWDALPFRAHTFDLVVFDPPHATGLNRLQPLYGVDRTPSQLIQEIIAGGREAYRVTRPYGLMALKWSERQFRFDRVLQWLPRWRPLFGHKLSPRTRAGSDVFWALLRKE